MQFQIEGNFVRAGAELSQAWLAALGCLFPSKVSAEDTSRFPKQGSTRALCSDPCKDFHSQLQAIAQLQAEPKKNPLTLS